MICTFYSYKGGVGRSMALANVADIMARRGLRVLMIDFDLEAPGLEQFFQINQRSVRRHLGLLDLLLSYKYTMSVAAGDTSERPFTRLRESFITPVYRSLPGDACLDLMPAGQREGAGQLARYAYNLRTFDWQDFYSDWAGEAFFGWLRRALVPELYDVVLADSRTGVTEMGGVCAYQLADVIVMFCGPNHQNLEGSRSLITDFFSPGVQVRRGNRPLQALVVPARVEQNDEKLLAAFRTRFDAAFEEFTPQPLRQAGITLWDLQIPYEPTYAFEEQVVTDPARTGERRKAAAAFQGLADAIARLGEPDGRLTKIHPEAILPVTEKTPGPAVEPQYDVTSQFARYDVFLSYSASDRPAVEQITSALTTAGIRPFLDRWNLVPGEPWQEALETALNNSSAVAVFVGPSGMSPWQNEEMRAALNDTVRARPNLRIIPVLLPGADLGEGQFPSLLSRRVWLDFRGGLDDESALRRFVAGIRGEAPGAVQTTIEYRNPYRGLSAFEEQDASFFFGRDALVKSLLDRLASERFLALVGASGSGKTSLVKAGLLPAIRRGALTGSENWPVVVLRPGGQPLEALATAPADLIVRSATATERISDAKTLADGLRTGQVKLAQVVALIIAEKPASRRLLLVIDQFEELFTLVRSEEERRLFITNILDAAVTTEAETTVVITLRADFYGQCLAYHSLAEALSKNLIPLLPMSAEEMRQAIERPAQATGLLFEPGLVERILADASGEPGALPLLQFTLLELWNRREGGVLTHRAYAELEGLHGALSQRAEAAYALLTPDQREAARRTLTRLVQMGEDGEASRRRVPFAEVQPVAGDPGAVEAVVRIFTDARLLVLATDPVLDATIELAHEALIRNWPRFVGWLAEYREQLIIRQRLTEAAEEWDRHERDESYLYRGTRLAQAEGWIRIHGDEMTHLEAEFVNASDLHQLREMQRAKRLRLMTQSYTLMAIGYLLMAALIFLGWVRLPSVLGGKAREMTVVLGLNALVFLLVSAGLWYMRFRLGRDETR